MGEDLQLHTAHISDQISSTIVIYVPYILAYMLKGKEPNTLYLDTLYHPSYASFSVFSDGSWYSL